MKGTIYGNRLPRGTQVLKGWELLLYTIPFTIISTACVCLVGVTHVNMPESSLLA